MSYFGLDRPRSKAYYLFYKVVFVLSLLALISLLGYATKSVEYTWRWYRIPQYFWATGEQDLRSDYTGEITAITDSGNEIRISVLTTDSPEPEVLLLPKGSTLTVSPDTTVYQGDIIAHHNYSKPGILLEALGLTLEVSAAAIVFGILIGLGTGLCRLSNNPALRWGSITYIEIIRGSPLLVQIFIWYFVAGPLIDKFLQRGGLSPIPPVWYGIGALAIFTGAYVAEIVRAGIQSVHRGQMEAARSLGMSHRQAMQKVILPQAFRRILPPLAGQFISLVKDSSLLGVMGVRELTKGTREAITSSLQSLELWFTCALLYLILTFTLSLFVQYLESRAVRR